ncbi:hypothetical protein FQA39_LY06236 [Lamprigera yunnana]|nr:hypothetical protein FQA39_LY06236 [Lamprigera yunnana]
MENLQQYYLESAPRSVYYIPNFITEEEESQLLGKIYSVPKPKWTCLSNRRLQDYGGVPHKNGMIVEPIPSWLRKHMKQVSDLKVFGTSSANHVLVNEYLPEQGIMPHTDGPLFFPTITTISCSSHTVLEFCTSEDRKNVCSLLLEPRSLVILKDDMYSKYLHYIKEVACDEITDNCVNLKNCHNKYEVGQVLNRLTRVSLTIRNVPKVRNVILWNLMLILRIASIRSKLKACMKFYNDNIKNIKLMLVIVQKSLWGCYESEFNSKVVLIGDSVLLDEWT